MIQNTDKYTTTISVCMIVRNAVSVLPRCLNSINGIYDQLCIVDTGSDDATPDIARENADNFESYHGCNDQSGRIINFADARNRCIAMAKGDWILSIDADEVYSSNCKQTLKDLLNNQTATAAAVTVSRGNTDWVAIRLFKNMPEQYFHHPVHELIKVQGQTLTLRKIHIRDLGQSNKLEASAERNLRICNHILKENSNDLRALFYRAEALRKRGDYTEAGKGYMDCLEHPRLSAPYRCATLESLAICFTNLGNWQEAYDAAQMITKIHPGLAESYCLMGDAQLALHRLPEAKACYQQAASLNYPPENYNLFVRKASYEEYPQNQLNSLREVCKKHGISFDEI